MLKPISHKMLFPSPKKLKPGTVSKIKPIECKVIIVCDASTDVIGNPTRATFTVDVRSEVHSSLQDLAATLFRRGVEVKLDKTVVVYGPRSISRIEMIRDLEQEKREKEKEEERVEFYNLKE